MKLRYKIKDIGLTTGGPYIVVLNDEDAKELDLHALDRIRLVKGKKYLTVAVDIAEKGILRRHIGLFDEVLSYLKVKHGDTIEIRADKRPESIAYIKKKLEGEKLSKEEIEAIVHDITVNNLNVVELTYFVGGFYSNGLSLDESVYLADGIYKYSNKLRFGKKVLSKHCIGGVPGNRTSMVVVPIIAALGYNIPKTSSRAITSASGTSDTIEVLCPVNLNINKIRKVVKKTKGCLIWGGTQELAGVDNNIINVERLLSLDPVGMLLASILTKQKIMGTTHLLVDIPIGENAKVKTYRRALKLKAKFILIGRRLGIKVKVIITDGSQPVGKIGRAHV